MILRVLCQDIFNFFDSIVNHHHDKREKNRIWLFQCCFDEFCCCNCNCGGPLPLFLWFLFWLHWWLLLWLLLVNIELDWNEIDIPESSEPTEPLLAIFSDESVKSNKELFMALFRMTTPFALDSPGKKNKYFVTNS